MCLLGMVIASGETLAQEPAGPRVPSPSQPLPSPVEDPQPATPESLTELSRRLREMEAMNRELAEELQRTRDEHAAQINQILERLDAPSSPAPDAAVNAALNARVMASIPDPNPADAPDFENPVPDYTEGQLAPYTPPPGYPATKPRAGGRQILLGDFGPGFQLETEDQEYRLLVHYESQIETRIWGQDQEPANSGFFMPRQRIFFSGNITRPIEYEFSINRGFSTLNILNAYINLHLNDQLEVRFGRFFTPLPYDQYAISNYWLLTPERSVFTTNLSLNRQIGMMGWGYLFDKRLDYAAGIFNGSRNSFESFTNGVDFVAYLNARPFQNSERLPFLKFLNLGSSVAYGSQDQAPVPRSFRIAGNSPNADVPGAGTTPFLILNPDVIERGERLLGSVHAAYYYKSLSLIGEWQYGYGGYALPNTPTTSVPFLGSYLAAGYFLTGEQVERRTRLYPLRPFITTKANRHQRGIGAWELTSRVAQLHLGDQVFSQGFADPALWSNQAVTTEVGLNWYLNEYMKVYMFWYHGEFGEPVLYSPGRFQETADMFWLRFQLYF